MIDLTKPQAAIEFMMGLGWARHQAAAIVGQGIWESGGRTHLNPTALGDAGTAHGAYQWRGDRYIGTKGLMAYTVKNFPGKSCADPMCQLSFVNWELTEGPERYAGNLLKEATNVEEATKAFIQYLRPAHTTKEHPELGHGYEKRLKLAQSLM